MNTPRRETILIVDDQEENLRVVGNVLSLMHYEVLLASNAEEAFLQLAQHSPDLILLDVMMPEIDGLTVCLRLKSHPRWADIPVIFLSADDDKNSIVQALETGGVDYVTKPFNRAELVSRVRTQLALKHARDRLRALAEDKDEILGILAHDLKNSLAGMKLSAGLLQTKNSELPPTCSPLVDNIMDATERMLAFMQEFLANQRAEHLQIKHVPVNLGDVLARVVSRHQTAAQVKRITLTAHIPKFQVHITGDREGTSQVLENLVSNAIKFSSPGSEVVVTLHPPAAGVVRCHVCDNGPGFTADDRVRLFRRYGRLSAQPTGHESSTGLGLFIVKRLVDAMSGTITLAENSGSGAEFIITWPLAHSPS
ncbi:response regulator [Prosthecobacter sp.]|uniref:hybrid sensor histidine kinase/response regulator n=1 Tax=Prosthecobacter sp. TaxID=1965333 RepID=UPI0037837762